MSDLINISVFIAERKYTLSVERKDEAIIRQAAETINDRIKEYSRQYQYTDKRDLLSMVTLSFTAALLKADTKDDDHSEKLKKDLSEIHQTLLKAV
ncbi:MAG: cell division protein ZapA [Marinilabiliales bacterium]|nr:MAG: cell division protein ZapA [Marinilabiliales bacterium]